MQEKLRAARKDQATWGEFQQARRDYKQIIKEEKKLYIESIKNELDNVKNMNEGWKFINKYKRNRDTHGTDKPKDTELNTL